MKAIVLAILLVLPSSLWGAKPNPADYTVTIHIVSSHLAQECEEPGSVVICGLSQHLNVLIGGKKFELEGGNSKSGILKLGNYKARQVQNDLVTPDEYRRVYEILFLDGQTKKYRVIGEWE
jgi:hypothetical protein